MKCPTCGTEIKDGSVFCTACGANIQAANSRFQPHDNPSAPATSATTSSASATSAPATSQSASSAPVQNTPIQATEQTMYQQPQQGMYQQPQQGMYSQPQQGMYSQPQQGMYQQPQYGQYPQGYGYAAPAPKESLGAKLKKLPKKVWIIGGSVLAAIIIAIVLFSILGGGKSGADTPEAAVETFYKALADNDSEALYNVMIPSGVSGKDKSTLESYLSLEYISSTRKYGAVHIERTESRESSIARKSRTFNSNYDADIEFEDLYRVSGEVEYTRVSSYSSKTTTRSKSFAWYVGQYKGKWYVVDGY